MRIHSAGNLREGWEMSFQKFLDLAGIALLASLRICGVAVSVAAVVGIWRLVLQ